LLKNCDEKFEALLEASEDLIFILDKKGCFTTINKSGARSLEYKPQELIGTHFLDIIGSTGKSSVIKVFQDILNNTGTTSFPVTFISKFGKEISYIIGTKPLNKEGVISEIIAAGKNVTKEHLYDEKINKFNNKLIEYDRLLSIERGRSAKQKSMLEELNRVKKEFISSISHELRTPLASIIGFSEAISSDPGMPEEMKNEFNKIILDEGKRLAKMIVEVLDVSQLQKSKFQANFKEFDINKLLKDTIEHNKNAIRLRKLKLKVELPNEGVLFFGDKEKISYIFNCLIENAVKHTGEGGRIKIILQIFFKEIEVIITDTGMGIHEKELPFIFKKYNKLDNIDEEYSISGLGLVFVKQIVDLHKGLISVQSEVNRGTSFTVKLPYNFQQK